MNIKKYFFSIILISAIPISSFPVEVPIELFDMSNYSQDANHYIDSSNKSYNKPILTASQQSKLFDSFISHTVGNNSPWSKSFLQKFTQKPNSIKDWTIKNLNGINNKLPDNQKTYQENYKPLIASKYNKIFNNIDLDNMNKAPIEYNESNRAIVVKATEGYSVPYSKPLYLKFTLPGQGYPFNNINESSLHIGEAVYIVSQSKDRKWTLVVTSSYYAWIKSDSIAKISKTQITKWNDAVSKARLSVRSFDTALYNFEDNSFITNTYPGTMLPILSTKKEYFDVLIPIKTIKGKLSFTKAKIKRSNATKIPLLTSPKNFVKVIKETQGYPYGWGNEYFYNDCSSELRAIYQAFGIWLPRNSKDQSLTYSSLNLDSLTPDQRLKTLVDKGQPFLNFLYIKGHIMLYVGKTNSPYDDNKIVPITYQQVWGLSDYKDTKRDIIGESVFLPLLDEYPQDKTLEAQHKKDVFRVIQVQ